MLKNKQTAPRLSPISFTPLLAVGPVRVCVNCVSLLSRYPPYDDETDQKPNMNFFSVNLALFLAACVRAGMWGGGYVLMMIIKNREL